MSLLLQSMLMRQVDIARIEVPLIHLIEALGFRFLVGGHFINREDL